MEGKRLRVVVLLLKDRFFAYERRGFERRVRLAGRLRERNVDRRRNTIAGLGFYVEVVRKLPLVPDGG